MKIGFIGQGYVGSNSADDFEARGYAVVRYSLEPAYISNKDAIRSCDVVFVAVPTPTTPNGFDASIADEALTLVGAGARVVIKSTLLPGTTVELQKKYPNIVVLFSPEFLCEATAAHDAAHPLFNIVGLSEDSLVHRRAAEEVLALLPKSERVHVMTATGAELFKYAHNLQGYMRVMLSNILYDTGTTLGVPWNEVQALMDTDPMMSPYYNAPIHKSGRGAGGHCFIKDMAAFARLYRELHPHDTAGASVLRALEEKNRVLLHSTEKDQDLVRGVYGDSL